MNTTNQYDLVDDMITELDRARTTKIAQMGYISDISEKSNNILLQIEASQKTKVSQNDESSSARYKYCKGTLHALAKTVEIFERLMNKNNTTSQPTADFETYITTTKAKIDFYGNAVRKLLALNDTVNQIGGELHIDSDYYDLDTTDTTGDPNSSE